MTASTALIPAAPAALARSTIAAHSRSFALASRLLSPRVRDQSAVVYTFCRRADDAVDLGTVLTCDTYDPQPRGIVDPAVPVLTYADAGAGDATLARLHGELASVYDGSARDPVLAAFGDVVRARQIPLAYPADLLAGMAADVHGAHYATLADLHRYAWQVAGVVGLMMAHVLGVRDDAALVPAAQLGLAMQLTNICRDVAEDWQRSRLYIPDELLAAHGAGGLAGDLARRSTVPASAIDPLRGAVRDLLALADRTYRAADRGIAALDLRSAIAVRAARNVYSAIGTQIARNDFDVRAPRAVVPHATKLALVAAAVARVTATSPRRLFARPTRIPTRTLEARDVPFA